MDQQRLCGFFLPFLCASLWILCVNRCCARNKIRSKEVNVKRTPNTDRPGDRGAVESGHNLFSIYGSAAFQLAFRAEERVRADVSELFYSGRGLPTHGRKETTRASLDDCSSGLVEHLSWRGDGYSNRRSPDSRRPQGLYRCGRFHCDRRRLVSASASKTRGSGVERCVNERRNPHAAQITVSSYFLFTVFSRGDDSVAQRLWGRLALNR